MAMPRDDFTTMAAHSAASPTRRTSSPPRTRQDMRVVLDIVCNHGGDLINNNSWIAPPRSTR